MVTINQPFTNAQLELLKLFSSNISEEDLNELRKVIVTFLAKKLMDKGDRVWEQEGWTENTMNEFLNTKLRKTN